jgi:hypothetical protein
MPEILRRLNISKMIPKVSSFADPKLGPFSLVGDGGAG